MQAVKFLKFEKKPSESPTLHRVLRSDWKLRERKNLFMKVFRSTSRETNVSKTTALEKKAKKMKRNILMNVFRSTSRGNSVSKTTVLENADDSEICFRAK